MEEFTETLGNRLNAGSTDSLIKELFELIKQKGSSVRTQKLNGLEEWQSLKNNYLYALSKQLILKNSNWRISIKINGKLETDPEKIYEIFLSLLNLKTEDDVSDPYWEQKHFFLQLIRIVKNNKICFVRLMQIAFNIGQFNAEYDWYDSEVKKVFAENKLSDIESYI